jgi:hypothetical protein
LAQRKPVCLRVWPYRQHLSDHAISPGAGLDDVSDLDTGHGKTVGQFVGGQVHIDVFS